MCKVAEGGIKGFVNGEGNEKKKRKKESVHRSDRSSVDPSKMKSKMNKAGYTAIQSRTVGQEQQCKNHSEFRNVTDRQTDGPTDLPTYRPTRQGVESRVRD